MGETVCQFEEHYLFLVLKLKHNNVAQVIKLSDIVLICVCEF